MAWIGVPELWVHPLPVTRIVAGSMIPEAGASGNCLSGHLEVRLDIFWAHFFRFLRTITSVAQFGNL